MGTSGCHAKHGEAEPDSTGEVDLVAAGERGAGWRYYVAAIGPGLVTGASDDDPSGIATYSQAGAAQGFGMLWTSLITFPLMTAVREICDRTALATGKSLGALVGDRWRGGAGKPAVDVLLVGLVAANGLNIAADLVAVGSGMSLQHAGPTWVWALVAGVAVTLLVTYGSFARIASIFKILCAALLVTSRWRSCCTRGPPRYCAACSFRTCISTGHTSRCWWRCWAPRSVPTCFSGSPRTGWKR